MKQINSKMVRLVSGVDNDYIYVYAGCYYPNVDRADNCSSIALFTKILTIKNCRKCKILIVKEILVLSFIVSEKNRKKDGRCIGAST